MSEIKILNQEELDKIAGGEYDQELWDYIRNYVWTHKVGDTILFNNSETEKGRVIDIGAIRHNGSCMAVICVQGIGRENLGLTGTYPDVVEGGVYHTCGKVE